MPRPNNHHSDVRTVNGKRIATPEYNSWQMMKNRCFNTNSKDYPYYGGRGITVCRRWLDYAPFLADMGRRPTPLHTLDRIRTSRNYTPSNCRWATRETQARNRPYAKVKAWVLAKKLGVSVRVAHTNIDRVYAKDRGDTHAFDLSPAREAVVRQHLENVRV
jgi:hypothetical protein